MARVAIHRATTKTLSSHIDAMLAVHRGEIPAPVRVTAWQGFASPDFASLYGGASQ